MSAKVGRNDPCPCGSGKKYKHCCLRKDRARHSGTQVRPRPTLADDSFESQLARARRMARTLLSHAPSEQARALQQMLDTAHEAAAYQARQGEIEAASGVLEAHRADFEAMMEDTAEVVQRAERLFAEAPFVPLRFSADDVYRAFEAVGYPSHHETATEKSRATCDAAILHLASKELRERLARQLMLSLPDYVAAGRYLDAWLIQVCAWQTVEQPERINAFLLEMFDYGFRAWAELVDGQEAEMVRELGLDPDQVRDAGVSFAELEAHVQAQMADPERKARLEAYFARHPIMRAQAEAEMWDLERSAALLLEREDAGCLYLEPEEMRPWAAPLLERLVSSREQAAKQAPVDEAALMRELRDVVIEVSKEMATALFTPDRVAQLTQALEGYRSDRIAANDTQAATYAFGALSSLQTMQDPAENPTLVGLCFASLRELLIALSEGAEERREEAEIGPSQAGAGS